MRRSVLMAEMTQGRPLEVLIVEDNPADARLASEAFAEGKVRTRLSITVDGVQAMDFLRRTGKFASAPRPDLVLLDLNLPKKDGREVLAEMKGDESLRRIPVVVLTTSQADADIMKTYDLHANCFITKPVDLDRFLAVVRYIEDFWLTMVSLPPR